MGGIYNKFQDDGLQIDDKRRLQVFALDYNNTISKLGTFITAEWTWVKVDVPETYTQQYGNRQHGGFVDIVQPVIKRKVLGWENAVVNLACRFEYVDWNVGYFRENNSQIETIYGALCLQLASDPIHRLFLGLIIGFRNREIFLQTLRQPQ